MFSVGLKHTKAQLGYLVFVEFAQILPLHHLSYHLPPGQADSNPPGVAAAGGQRGRGRSRADQTAAGGEGLRSHKHKR